jgi:hypothetical protein
MGAKEARLLGDTLTLRFGPEIAHILQQIGEAMGAVGPLASIASTPANARAAFDWWKNPYARDKAVRTAIAYLQNLLPEADAVATATPVRLANAEGTEVGDFADLLIARLNADEPDEAGG